MYRMYGRGRPGRPANRTRYGGRGYGGYSSRRYGRGYGGRFSGGRGYSRRVNIGGRRW